MTSGFNYSNLMQQAFRNVMVDVISDVAENGLPGDHHFYITLNMTHPGVVTPAWMKEEYPEELTIVIQHEYWNLAVIGDRFSIDLSFRDKPCTILAPFDSVLTFADPSQEFGMKFEAIEMDESITEVEDETEEETTEMGEPAEVVSLDAFRNKN